MVSQLLLVGFLKSSNIDIDANGIVHVKAKDLGTQKEQKITITSSSGLKEEEIDRMVKEAEAHAAEDKARKEELDVKNNADSLVYQAEKALKDLEGKGDAALMKEVEEAKDKLKNLSKLAISKTSKR